jgi:hypothetical protein
MVRLTWTEGRKGTLFSRLFCTTKQARDWGETELRPYGIGYAIERTR